MPPATLPSEVRDPPPLLIGDEWVRADDAYAVVNPATEAVVGFAPEATAVQAREAAAAARAAQPAWAALAMEERCRLLALAVDALEARLPDFVSLVQAETGSTLAVARRMQIDVAADRFRRYARPERVDQALEPQITPATPLGAGSVLGAQVVRQPVGVVACITPYNFPLTSLAGKIAPALAMGNTVVMKPAPQDPLAIFEMARILREVGFPPGVVNLVCGSGPEVGAALVASQDVDMVSFTGSSAVGVRIYEQGAPTMKRLLLELGGKGPALVFADADLDAAAAAVGSTFAFHSGQVCTAPTRLLAQRAVFEPMLERLAHLARALPIGDPLDPATVVGPVISRAQRDRIEAFVRSGRDEGAEVLAGGVRPDRPGCYVAPCLLVGRNDMLVAREEAFGPVVVAMPFDDEDEAVALANDSDYGLFGYVYTKDSPRGMRVAKRLRTGCVGVNTVQPHHEAPFGGFKRSGVGRDRGVFGLHAYAELQSITWPG
jgi:acyl-CoA reductase-like NAD-dependent aldehyde dehydrogenase